MRQLMGNHIMGEIFRAIRQERPENHATTAVSQLGARYPDGASLARNIIIHRQSKARVLEEIGKDRLRQPLHHRYDPEREGPESHGSLDIPPEILIVFGPGHVLAIVPGPAAALQAGTTSIVLQPRMA